MSVKYFVLLSLLFLSASLASDGDTQNEYRHCLDECVQVTCPTPLDASLRLLHWNCPENCRYTCMQSITDEAQERGLPIYQYYGKWPFYRVLGIQEPASVLFSIGNGLVHLYYFFLLRKKIPTNYHLKTSLLLYPCVGMNAWLWSTIFHGRDVHWTELMDYFSAFSLVLYSLFFALIRVFQVQKHSTRLLGLLFLCGYLSHIIYLSAISFDYVYNMYVNVTVGVLQVVVWVYWYITQTRRSYAYLAVISGVGVSVAMCLELFDFPPLWRVFDAHSLWHFATIPLTIIWYKFLLADMWFENQNEKVALLPA